MKYNNLQISRQAKSRRRGRGISAGRGKTAGRGTKGQGARKSGGVRPGFEGGQMPLYMRLPKLKGFKSHARPFEVVYTGQLDAIKKITIDNQAVFDVRLVSSPHTKVKLIVKGDLKSKKDVKLQAASRASVDMIIKAGGSFTLTNQVARPSKKAVEADESR